MNNAKNNDQCFYHRKFERKLDKKLDKIEEQTKNGIAEIKSESSKRFDDLSQSIKTLDEHVLKVTSMAAKNAGIISGKKSITQWVGIAISGLIALFGVIVAVAAFWKG